MDTGTRSGRAARTARTVSAALAVTVLLAGCASGATAPAEPDGGPDATSDGGAVAVPPFEPSTSPSVASPASPVPATVAPLRVGPVRPAWLGTRVLPVDGDGNVPPQETPAELRDRRLPPSETPSLPDPFGSAFASTITEIPADVLARSTWTEDCPVTHDGLRYLTVTFWGFDDRAHTGEMIVNATVAEDVVRVFRIAYDARFPIEEMYVVPAGDLDAPPTGDGNTTTSFVCRQTVGSTRWSQHAYGLAVDINPFHNPYVKGDVLLPELARAYADRTSVRPGMFLAGDAVTSAFAAIGWGWGGTWNSLTDPMHFSRDNR